MKTEPPGGMYPRTRREPDDLPRAPLARRWIARGQQTITQGLISRVVLTLTLLGLATGGAAYLSGRTELGQILWAGTTAVALVPLTVTVVRDLVRREVGVDVIALLAMASALAVGEYLAGGVVAVMLSGGQVLEARANARARRELSALIDRAPRIAHRESDGDIVDVHVDDVAVGDTILVRPGEVVPVDGVVIDESAVFDEAALTGESVPVVLATGDRVPSGSLNAGGPTRMHAAATAEESTYAGIVRLVREAEASKAPFVRLADRYALWFLPLTLVVAGSAWLLSGDPVRAVAVLVVATPCPLILAAPIAIVSGVSRAARRGVVVKGGAVLEAMARADVLLFDKTGTLTAGMPQLLRVESLDSVEPDEILRLAASVDQVSVHVLAEAIVRSARERGLGLAFPTDVDEHPGLGIRGVVDGRPVAVGAAGWVAGSSHLSQRAKAVRRRTAAEGGTSVAVSLDGSLVGMLILSDPVRPDALRTIKRLRRSGIRRVVMVTGDSADVAATVGAALGADHVYADRSPAEKVAVVAAEKAAGTVIMVGDGINDAPALAAADIGIAMGARGATASSQAADAVLLVDRLDRLAEARDMAQRSRHIALQSVLWGMGLSIVAMGFAAIGMLPPAAGALLQEGIDVAVIANALRALSEGKRKRVDAEAADIGEWIRAEHRNLWPRIEKIRWLADRLDSLPADELSSELAEMRRFLVDDLLPHETTEEEKVYPVVARLMGGDDPTGTMSRAHAEIAHAVHVLSRLVDDLPSSGPGPDDISDMRRVLYGLDAVLRLHFTQEEEAYLTLMEERSAVSSEQPKQAEQRS